MPQVSRRGATTLPQIGRPPGGGEDCGKGTRVQFIKYLESLGASAARVIWWLAILGALGTAAVAYGWWQGGHATMATVVGVFGAACVLPSTMLAEALSDLASLRRTVGQGYQRVTQPDRTRGQRAADGVFSALSVSWLVGSAAMLSNPVWWLISLAGIAGCVGLTLWALLWGLMLLIG